MPVGDLRRLIKNVTAALRGLEQKGLIHLSEKEISRGPGPAAEFGSTRNGVILNEAQAAALEEIRRCLASGVFSPCLLHGVTGSGKTEVYLQAIAEVLRGGGGAIYLVPEIALTGQLLSRVGSRFPEREIAVLHSGISPGARYDQWKRIRRGEVRVVVGARSALFAPVRNLRLIVVDEEHDSSYKQDDRLRYNARDLALVRGRFSQATVILGSATPAIQSYFHAARGSVPLLDPAHPDRRPPPSPRRSSRSEDGAERAGTDAASLARPHRGDPRNPNAAEGKPSFFSTGGGSTPFSSARTAATPSPARTASSPSPIMPPSAP